MTKFWKILLSVASFLFVMLAASAAAEIYYGEQRPGIAQLAILIIEGPLLWLIWRKRPDRV